MKNMKLKSKLLVNIIWRRKKKIERQGDKDKKGKLMSGSVRILLSSLITNYCQFITPLVWVPTFSFT